MEPAERGSNSVYSLVQPYVNTSIPYTQEANEFSEISNDWLQSCTAAGTFMFDKLLLDHLSTAYTPLQSTTPKRLSSGPSVRIQVQTITKKFFNSISFRRSLYYCICISRRSKYNRTVKRVQNNLTRSLCITKSLVMTTATNSKSNRWKYDGNACNKR